MSDWTICNGCGQRIPAFDHAHACPAQTGAAVIAPSASRVVEYDAANSDHYRRKLESDLDRLRKENAALREALQHVLQAEPNLYSGRDLLRLQAIVRAAMEADK